MNARLTLLLIAMLLVGGCSRTPSLTGRWECSTTHPGGFISKDIFVFSKKGDMTLDSDGALMHGSYQHSDKTLTMHLIDVPVPPGQGVSRTQQQILTATVSSLTAKELQMDVSTGNDHHLSSCRRK